MLSVMHRIFGLLAIASFASACTTMVLPYRGAVPNPRHHPDNSSFFAYKPEKSTVFLDELPSEGNDLYQTFYLELSTPENRIEATYYRSRATGKKRLIIILPLYGKHELPAVFVASHFALWNPYADFNVLYLQEHAGDDPLDLDALVAVSTEEEMLAALRDSKARFQRAVIGIRRLTDWAESEQEIDIQRVGLVGLSTSALVAGVAMGVDERIAAGAIFMGGGNLDEMFAYAQEPRIKKIRDTVIRHSGKTAEELQRILKPLFWDIEPVRYAANLDSSRVLYVDAKFDEYIPYSGREAFWHAAGEPERITFLHGHKTSFISTTVLNLSYTPRKMMEFFRKILN